MFLKFRLNGTPLICLSYVLRRAKKQILALITCCVHFFHSCPRLCLFLLFWFAASLGAGFSWTSLYADIFVVLLFCCWVLMNVIMLIADDDDDVKSNGDNWWLWRCDGYNDDMMHDDDDGGGGGGGGGDGDYDHCCGDSGVVLVVVK